MLQCIATAPVVAGAKRNELGSQTPQSTSRRLVLQVRPCTDKWSRWTGRMRRYPGGGRGRASRRAVVRPVRRSVPSAPRRIVSLSSPPTRAAGSTLLRAMPRLAGDRGPVCRRAAQLRAGRSARWSPPQTISRCFWRILQAVSTRRRAMPMRAGGLGRGCQKAEARPARRSPRWWRGRAASRCFSPIPRVVSTRRRATPPTAGARGQVSQRAGVRLAVLISAVLIAPKRVALFLADSEGGIYATELQLS